MWGEGGVLKSSNSEFERPCKGSVPKTEFLNWFAPTGRAGGGGGVISPEQTALDDTMLKFSYRSQ